MWTKYLQHYFQEQDHLMRERQCIHTLGPSFQMVSALLTVVGLRGKGSPTREAVYTAHNRRPFSIPGRDAVFYLRSSHPKWAFLRHRLSLVQSLGNCVKSNDPQEARIPSLYRKASTELS